MASALVIGDALLDVHVAPSEPMRPGGDVPAAIRLEPGGQGANVAVRLARRGMEVSLMCALADDPAGAMLSAAFAADGVDVIDLGAEHTGTVVVLLDGMGERTMLSQRVPLVRRLGLDWPESLARLELEWLVVSGYVLLERGAGISFAGQAPTRRVVLGCSLDAHEAARWIAAAASLQPHLVIVNQDEARTLAGEDLTASELSRRLGRHLDAVVIVTHAGGTAATIGRDTLDVNADPGGPAVDTTGAGDAFAAALLADLVPTDSPPDPDRLRAAMTVAVAVAAAVARTPGAQARVEGER